MRTFSQRIWVPCNLVITMVFIASLLAQTVHFFQKAQCALGVDIASVLPAVLPGWKVSEISLADTPAASDSVKSFLKFDSYVYRKYKYEIEEKSFDIYAAYWSAGRVPVQVGGGHTPDGCWVGSGWRLEARLPPSLIAPTAAFAGGQYRRFSDIHGVPIYVAYWHFVDGVQYGEYGKRYDTLRDAFIWWLMGIREMGQPREQLFIRISSRRSISEVFRERQLQEVMDAFAKLRSSRSVLAAR